MANLGVILISGQELVANLAASLSEPNDHPWAFTKWIRQMAGLTEGTYVAWIELVDAQGKQVNRFTPSSAELRARRVVVGQVAAPIAEASQPFFDGYPFEFRFKSPDDKAFDPALSTVEAAEWLNSHIDDLGLQPDQLSSLIGHAKSNTSDLSFEWLALALVAIASAAQLTRVHVRSQVPYVVLGVVCWYALHESGVHATIAGVAFGFVCPVWSFFNPARFVERARPLLEVVEAAYHDPPLEEAEHEHGEASLQELARLATESVSPLDRNEGRLAPWVGFVVVPVFALANAGVELGGATFGRVAAGVAVGLVVGKTVGVFAAAWLAVRVGVGRLPAATSWSHMIGMAMCAGIGFTVALFVAGLSFDVAELDDEAKIGILAGSLVAGVAGYLWLRLTGRPAEKRES